MLVGVLSDTHLREGRSLPRYVWEVFEHVDLILHAGDLVAKSVLDDLACLAPVRAVRGNCDGWELSDLPNRDIISLDDLRIGLVHGYSGIGSTTPERAKRSFSGDKVDVVVFGHSHSPYKEWDQGILLFNPGSPTNKRREARFSIGILEISGSEVRADHLFFD